MKFESEVAYFVGAVSPEMCDRIIAFGESFEAQKGYVAATTSGVLDTNIRNDRIVRIPDDAKSKWLNDGIWNLICQLNDKYWKFDLVAMENLQYSIYEKGGWFDWHRDTVDYPTRLRSNAPNITRKLSVTIQLSDSLDYEGGAFEIAEDTDANEASHFHDHEMRAAIRQRGTIVGFPSMLRHRVSPIISGTRRALVAWAGGPAPSN